MDIFYEFAFNDSHATFNLLMIGMIVLLAVARKWILLIVGICGVIFDLGEFAPGPSWWKEIFGLAFLCGLMAAGLWYVESREDRAEPKSLTDDTN